MLIEVKNLAKRLGQFQLNNISFQVEEGFIYGLVGRNGAGKTSLLHILLGLYKPDVGEVLLFEKKYKDAECEIRNRIGVVLAEELFDGHFTLEMNVKRYGQFFEKHDEKLLESYLTRFGLDKKKKYKALSRGEKMKFQLAFALSNQPELLILDEPTGNFDPKFRQDFWTIVKEFISDGTRSVIIATHLTDELDKMADYILYLDDGKLIINEDIESLRDNYFSKEITSIADLMYFIAKKDNKWKVE